MYERIKKLCNEEGKKYIYAYDENQDAIMHQLGSNIKEAMDDIKEINKYVEN